jgi:CRISPR-associated endoribonuclease Cas6
MKIALILKPISNFKRIGYNYNYQVSSFITNLSDGIVHDDGSSGKYSFFMDFCKYNTTKNFIEIEDKCILYISSHNSNFIEKIKEKIDLSKIYRIGDLRFIIERFEVKDFEYKSSTYLVRTLSPILVKHDGIFLNPSDEQYIPALVRNIKKKVGFDGIKIQIVSSEIKKKIIEIKGGKKTGYLYDFMIGFEKNENLEKVFESGFGCMNSQGFGFIEILKSN